jgi:hypothetical protein
MRLETKNCIEKFVRYEKKTNIFRKDGKKLGTTSEIISGIEDVNKNNYIHISTSEFGDFKDKANKVPNGFKKLSKKKYMKIAQDFYCKNPKSKKEKQRLTNKLKGALEINNWYDNSRKYWLTIKDIEKLKPNNKLVVLPLHRNVYDGPITLYKENKSYKPESFFKYEKDVFIHSGDLNGIFLKYDKNDNQPKGLDVEYKKDRWYPISNGYLPARDKQKVFKLLDKKTHWTKFAKNTHVGFRGPLILWSNLKKLPNIYFTNG